MTKTVIQLFARPAVKGRVKTRLIPELGAEIALSIYRYCLDFNLSLIRHSGFDYQIWLSEETDAEWHPGESVKVQQGDNLGDRMLFAMSSELQRKNSHFERVILIGSDCLDLTQELLNKVDKKLDTHNLVIIPARDGGYVLIAARQSINALLFSNISWGSQYVLLQTLEKVMQSGIKACILNPLRDIDRYDDLQHYAAFQHYL